MHGSRLTRDSNDDGEVADDGVDGQRRRRRAAARCGTRRYSCDDGRWLRGGSFSLRPKIFGGARATTSDFLNARGLNLWENRWFILRYEGRYCIDNLYYNFYLFVVLPMKGKSGTHGGLCNPSYWDGGL